MSGAIKSVNIKRITLEYSDGTVLVVPEDKSLKVGTAFMKIVGKENLEWHVQKKGESLVEKFGRFFKI